MSDKTTTTKLGFELEVAVIPVSDGRAIEVSWLCFRWLDRKGEVCEVAIRASEDADWASMDLEAMGRRVGEMVRKHGRLGA